MAILESQTRGTTKGHSARFARLAFGALQITAALLLNAAASAEEIAFGPDLHQAGWKIVSFPGVAPASFKAAGRAAAGLLCKGLSRAQWQARRARWRWRVIDGVPPTNLTRRGADDRALAVYFVFGAAEDAGKSPTAMLSSFSVTALVYIFGGDEPRGQILGSPHMGVRGKFIVLRSADTPKSIWFDEDVDLAKDHLRAFGQSPLLLLAVAIMSDSDDTRKRKRAELSALIID